MGTEATTKSLDALNILSKIDLYVSYETVKLHLNAYRHIVGVDAHNNNVLLEQLSLMTIRRVDLPLEQAPVGMNTRSTSVLLWINSLMLLMK